jgi:hypothetical protein
VRAVDEFDDSEVLPISCVNCRAPMPADEDLCDHCGYHRILKKVIDLTGIERADKDRSTGLERAIKRQLNESETVESTLRWAKILVGFLGLVFLRLLLGRFWWLGVVAVGGLLAWLYFRRRVTKSGGETDSRFNRDPLVTLVWNVMLMVQRAIGWRQLAWPFKTCLVLTLRDPTFGDEDLARLQNLGSFEAIDLEGTRITDAGLVHLKDARALQFLVLKRTQVTSDGMQRLQLALDKTLIWG